MVLRELMLQEQVRW
jgi:hypothetical protein